MNINITLERRVTEDGWNFSNSPVPDLATTIDTLLTMRSMANTTSHLANHMRRDALEEYFDGVVERIDADLDAIEKELLDRTPDDPAEVADIEDLVVRIAFATRPGERGMILRQRVPE